MISSLPEVRPRNPSGVSRESFSMRFLMASGMAAFFSLRVSRNSSASSAGISLSISSVRLISLGNLEKEEERNCFFNSGRSRLMNLISLFRSVIQDIFSNDCHT